jgi:hypothetical protein
VGSVWGGIAWGWAAALLLVLLQAGIGQTLLRRWPDLLPPGGLGLLLRQTAGAAAAAAVLMAAALLGPGLTALTGTLAVLALAALAAPGLRDLARARPALRRPPLAALLAALVVTAPYLVETALPNTDWDGAAYHLPLGRTIHERGIQAVDPFLPQINFPGSTHMAYALLRWARAGAGIIPLNLLMSLLLLAGTHGLARHFFGPRAAAWAATLLASSSLVWELGTDPRIDGFLAAQALAAVGALLLWVERPERRALLPVAGAALGLALGTKYTAAVLAAAVGLPALVLAARRRAWKPLLVGVALIAFPAGWWYARNQALLGNALYPYVRGFVYPGPDGRMREFQPDLDRLLATAPRPPAGFLSAYQLEPGVRRHMLDLSDVILHPNAFEDRRYPGQVPFRLGPLLVLGFLLPLFRRDRWSWWVWGLALALWIPPAIPAYMALLRYVLPAFPLLAIGAALAIERARGLMLPAGLALAATLGWNLVAEVEKLLGTLRPWTYLAGREARLDWLARVGYNGAAVAPKLARFVRDAQQRGEIERDATLFLVGEEKDEPFECRVLPDMSRDGYRWLVEMVRHDGDPERIRASLRAQGIGWVAVNFGYFTWVLRSVPMNLRRLANRSFLEFSLFHLEAFLKRYGKAVWAEDEVYLYDIRGAP